MTELATRRALLRAQAQGSLAAARAVLSHAIQISKLVLETDPDQNARDAVVALETAAADLATYLRRPPRSA